MKQKVSGKESKISRKAARDLRARRSQNSGETVEYLVRLSDRALRNLAGIFDFVESYSSADALAWFRKLEEAIYSLERFPYRGSPWRQSKNCRQLLFGKKPSTYKIIYVIDRRKLIVKVLHFRHCARIGPNLPG